MSTHYSLFHPLERLRCHLKSLPHDSLLNSEDSLTIKNDYRDSKIKQSFAGRSVFSHLPTSNIK